MLKKRISLLLAVCMLICLSACGTTETNSNSTDTLSESQTDTAQGADENTLREENSQVSSNIEETNENDTQTQTTVSQSKPTSTTNQPTHTHSYSNATCTSPKKCSCGATVGTALGHQFSSATCTSPKICSRCGTTSGNALGHNYSDANCTTPKRCSRCGATAGIALGHQFSSATCTSPEICNRCGTTNANALGHNYSDANCNSPKTCTRCGQTSGSALGHNYVNNKCTRCGMVDPDSLPVGLNNLFLIDSYKYEYKSGTFIDSFGNSYNGVHYYTDLYQANNGREPHSEFNLDGKYKLFAGSIVASTKTNADWTYYVNIYVDGVLKFSKTGFSKTSGKVDFKIDVTNGGTLKITAGKEGSMGDFNQEIGIVNAQLTK